MKNRERGGLEIKNSAKNGTEVSDKSNHEWSFEKITQNVALGFRQGIVCSAEIYCSYWLEKSTII